MANGINLTKLQISKIERITKLFDELKKEGVEPLIIEGGGSPTLTFFRNADLDVDILYKHNRELTNNYHRTGVAIDMWVP